MYENSYFDYVACHIHIEKVKENQEKKKYFLDLVINIKYSEKISYLVLKLLITLANKDITNVNCKYQQI